MIGDGKTKYDHDHDNEAGEVAACSVSIAFHSIPL
jgi:mannose-binding lectin 2